GFAIRRRMRQTRAMSRRLDGGEQGAEVPGSPVPERGADEAAVLDRLAALEIETPSWGYGNSGTRFHVYPWPGAARSVFERIADAALVHRLTGCCPPVALHIPWDEVEDYAALRRYAEEEGVRLGSVNPNTFGADDYQVRSQRHTSPA